MKALGLIFCNINEGMLSELTSKRTLASVPFAGRYRLIDFVLSSMVNSGIDKVGVITQSNYQSLIDHIGNGKSWDLARKNGGLILLPPFSGGSMGMVANRLDAIKSALPFLKRSTEDYVVLSDCDNVANIDYLDVINQHIASGADFTMVYRQKDVSQSEAKQRTLLELDSANRVKSIVISDGMGGKKGKGHVVNVWANMIVASRNYLISTVEDCIARGAVSFRRDILRRTDVFKVYGYKYEGYFATVDSLSNYYKHSMEMLHADKRGSLFEVRPVYTKVRDSAPCKVHESAKISNSLIADGCEIEGTVKDSILFRGVRVKKGAEVVGCVIMQDGIISENAHIAGVIADKNVIVSPRRRLSGCADLPYYIPKSLKL